MSGQYSANAFTLAPASPQAAAISQLFTGTLIFLGAILVLVWALVIYALVRYRDRPGAPKANRAVLANNGPPKTVSVQVTEIRLRPSTKEVGNHVTANTGTAHGER